MRIEATKGDSYIEGLSAYYGAETDGCLLYDASLMILGTLCDGLENAFAGLEYLFDVSQCFLIFDGLQFL